MQASIAKKELVAKSRAYSPVRGAVGYKTGVSTRLCRPCRHPSMRKCGACWGPRPDGAGEIWERALSQRFRTGLSCFAPDGACEKHGEILRLHGRAPEKRARQKHGHSAQNDNLWSGDGHASIRDVRKSTEGFAEKRRRQDTRFDYASRPEIIRT